MIPTKEKEPTSATTEMDSATVNDSQDYNNNITYNYKNVKLPACVIRSVEDSARVLLALGQLTGIKRYYAELKKLNDFLSEVEEVCGNG